MKNYRLSKRADEQLDEIVDYIAERNPDAAKRVVAALERTFATVAHNPKVGQRRDDLQSGLRVFPATRPADRYVVLFYETADVVEISHIVHGSRDWPALFQHGDL